MRAFFVLQKWYFQPCLGEGDFLKCVEVLKLLLSPFVQDRVRKGEEAAARADFIGVRSGCKSLTRSGLFRDSLPELIHVHARKIQLAHFFLQRHAAHQVVDSPLDRLLWIEIQSGCNSRLRMDLTGQHQDHENEQYCRPSYETCPPTARLSSVQVQHVPSLLFEALNPL